jgi:hypothetical protein
MLTRRVFVLCNKLENNSDIFRISIMYVTYVKKKVDLKRYLLRDLAVRGQLAS